ncbi:hypothetical protein H3C70_05395 [Patescibacteria group bacterium]|nr:hypothetical protein [Patescibacteria group bacterium]
MKSTNIFRPPSFLKGMARVVDLFGQIDEYKYTQDPDLELLGRDWEIIGKDLESEFKKHEQHACSPV